MFIINIIVSLEWQPSINILVYPKYLLYFGAHSVDQADIPISVDNIVNMYFSFSQGKNGLRPTDHEGYLEAIIW